MNTNKTNDEDLKDKIEDNADFQIAGDEGEGQEVMDIDQAEKQTGNANDDHGPHEIKSFTDE